MCSCNNDEPTEVNEKDAFDILELVLKNNGGFVTVLTEGAELITDKLDEQSTTYCDSTFHELIQTSISGSNFLSEYLSRWRVDYQCNPHDMFVGFRSVQEVEMDNGKVFARHESEFTGHSFFEGFDQTDHVWLSGFFTLTGVQSGQSISELDIKTEIDLDLKHVEIDKKRIIHGRAEIELQIEVGMNNFFFPVTLIFMGDEKFSMSIDSRINRVVDF